MRQDQTQKFSVIPPFSCYFPEACGFFVTQPICNSYNKPKSEDFVQPPSPRRVAFDRISKRISECDLPGVSYLLEYLRDQYRRNCSANTLQITSASMIHFLSFYRKAGKIRIEQIDRQDIEGFIEHEQDRGLKPNSVRTRICVLYAFLRFLIKKKVLSYELLEEKIRLRLPENLPRAMAPEHVKQLLSVLEHPRERAMILILLRTGMRIGELLHTQVDDIVLDEQKILIYESDKTKVGRVVYFSEDALQALLGWLRVREPSELYLFYGQGHSHLSYESSRMIFRSCLQKAGLEYNGYTLHSLRHTFATDLLNARIPLECLRILLGHTSLEVTRRYARLTDKTREEEYFSAMNRVVKNELD